MVLNFKVKKIKVIICKKLMIRIQDLILWHAWPKFTPNNNGETPMKCNVSVFEKLKFYSRSTDIYLHTVY